MNYFTPELHVRLQSADPCEMDSADAQWEQARAAYQRRLQSIRAKLPASARQFLDETRLHDAEVLWMGQAPPLFGLLFRLDLPSTATLGLHYSGVNAVRFERQRAPHEFCRSRMLWMYDEIDLGGEDGCFRHAVLFSDGSQLELEARQVHATILDTVYSQFELPPVTASAWGGSSTPCLPREEVG